MASSIRFHADYRDRGGYANDFLRPGQTDARVFLPRLRAALARQALPLLHDSARSVLDYHHFSVVMHARRRFAIYSAANVDFNGRFALDRPKDVWRVDPRIDAAAQIGSALYADNQLDRGHLSRREDLEFGANADAALAAAADTCHWTNCTPQHARFNEGKQLWQGIERHILEDAVAKARFRAQVITGPVFDDNDPVLPNFQDTPYPMRFWKVVAAINASNALFATAYVLDQRETIAQFGVRGAPAVPFTPYKTFQTTIAVIERLTGLVFEASQGARRVSLRAFDPLAATPAHHPATRELPAADQEGIEIRTLNDIVVS